MVVALHWQMNRNPDLWGKDSNDFRPERFFKDDDEDTTDTIENNEKKQKLSGPPYFIPFQVIRKQRFGGIFDL